MREKFNDPDHKWITYVETHYNANSIDLRNNINTDMKARIAKKIVEANRIERANTIKKNNELQKEIADWNDKHKDDEDFVFRSFTLEKIFFKEFTEDTFPVKCGCLSSTFTENPYISFDEYLDAIRSVDIKTKTSPYVSDDSE